MMVSGNGEIRIDEALRVMNAGGVKNRIEGVTDLITIFKHNRHTSSLEVLKDGAYHTIYEALFKVATEEKRLYLSAKNDKARTKAEGTLSSCSEALRITIKAGAEKLKPKTVRAIIEHITQLLPVATGEYCLAFSQQYLKVLSTLLDHDAHVELLDQDDWLATVDFCLNGIKQYENDSITASIPHGSSITIPLSTASSGYTSRSRSSAKSVLGDIHLSSIKKRNSEELMECLLSLISAPNAPVSERTGYILKSIEHFLNSQGNVVTLSHQIAFAALNVMLSVTGADEISLTSSVAFSIIPSIGRLWSSKTAANDEMLNAAKDEMVITILLLRLHLEKLVIEDHTNDLGNMLKELRDSLANDYEKRAERDQLQLDDIDISIGQIENRFSDSLNCGYLRLRQHAFRAERKWAVVQALAILDKLLYGASPKSRFAATDDYESLEAAKQPRKRRRITGRFDALISDITHHDHGVQLVALQTLFFALPASQLSQHALVDILTTLASLVLDRSVNISCWTMLCIASCAQQHAAEINISSFGWKQLWHTVSRLVTSRFLCRPSCYLLHVILAKKLVEYKDVVEWATAMLTVTEISAPAAICDSSLALMTHLVRMRSTEGSGGSSSPGQNVVRWVFSKWNPAEKTFAARSPIDIHPIDVFNLLRSVFDLPGLVLCTKTRAPGGVIRQAWLRHRQNETTLRFLLLLDDEPGNSTDCSKCVSTSGLYQCSQASDISMHGNSMRRVVADMLLSKVQSLAQEWELQGASEGLEISSDVMHTAVSACVTSCLVLAILGDADSSAVHDISHILERLRSLISSINSQGNINRVIVEAMLQAIQPYLPAVNSGELQHVYHMFPQLGNFIVSLAEIFTRYKFQKEDGFITDDILELDSVFDTQQSWTRSERSQNVVERREMAMSLSPAAFFNNVSAKLILAASLKECQAETCVPTTFWDYLLNLPSMDIVSCGNLINEILHGDLPLELSDASRLVHCAGGLLSSQYSCCEVTIGFCVDTMKGLLPLWAHSEHGELGELVQQLYGWLVSTVIAKGRSSPNVKTRISNLLFELIRTQPTYGDNQSLPSVRSSLFDVLQQASIPVKFSLAQKIPDIFGLFVLKTHLRILSDLLESLPTDLDWSEGNAFRLYILSRLASRWPTLLRICTYYILEVSGRVPLSIPYAKRCLLEISDTLGLSSTRELFQLFNSQLLFTWLDTEPLESLPHSIFGYDTLFDLLEDSQDEVSALMVMRDRDAEVNKLAELLKEPVELILTRSFAKVIAYSVSHDISIPPSDTSRKYITGEARVRKQLGKDAFLNLVKKNFADILSLLFKLIDHEQDLEKSFMKEDSLQLPASILSEIKGFSSSNITLPPSQQPTFKAKYLTREINHICGRTPYEPSDIFTPSMVTFIIRKLIDTMNPALGSLHTCSVLRRLRVLIGLAGPNAVTGYPLELLLHNLTPLLGDVECADDAIGIAQYLFTRGAEYLSTVPSFVTTITLSMFGSLKEFLSSSPSSTTQESQYRQTLSKAESFHSWLGRFLSNFKASGLDRNAQDAFRAMVESAQALSSSGSTDVGTAGGDLLMDILRDKRSRRNLLSKSSSEIVFSLLYNQFAAPKSFRSDHLGQDDRAVRYAPTLWELCKNGSASGSFLTWAGRVFGRAFAATGYIEPSLLKETDLHEILGFLEVDPSNKPSSRTSILRLVRNLTVVEHGSVTGMAEAALRVIVSGIIGKPNDADDAACSMSLSSSLRQCSTWSPFHIPPTDMLAFETSPQKDPFSPASIEDPGCIRNLSVFLVQSVPSDAVIHPIQQLLVDAVGFAEKCFPFILHIVLSQQLDESQTAKRHLSAALRSWFSNEVDFVKERLKLLINTILYLRTQPLPRETSIADRAQWLDIDYRQASQAAAKCGMFKTALLFTELSSSESLKVSRRSSAMKPPEPKEMLFLIFKNLDDPDIFYGLQRTANLENISARMEYEKDGLKTLMFRGAEYDSHMRNGGQPSSLETQSLVGALSMLNLDGLSHSLLQSQQNSALISESAMQNMFRTARKLEQWDLPIPDAYDDGNITIYKTFQGLINAVDRGSAQFAIDTGISSAMSNLIRVQRDAASIHTSLQALSVFAEIDEVLSSSNSEEFEEMLQRFEDRSKWMKTGNFEDVSQIISSRQTLLSCVNQHSTLRNIINVSASDTQLVEARTSLLSSSINRSHGALQESLTSATYLNSIIESCRDLGLSIEAATYFEVANAMWDQGEMASSIGMLQELDQLSNLKQQTIPIGKSKILAKIASQVSIAKLEKPDHIIEKYLSPALVELKGKTDGNDAGQVYHEFAVFCDRQYQDPDSIEDLERLRRLKEMKEIEVATLLKLSKEATSGQKQRNHRAYNQAKQWLELDTEEYERLNDGRAQLLRRSLENYLLSLVAWDDCNNDALRFTALWLEHSDEEAVSESVSKHLSKVATLKFAALANQLTSRLLDTKDHFQVLLLNLVLNICKDHPYHGMYQIWAGTNSNPSANDETALSRQKATKDVALKLSKSPRSSAVWSTIDRISQQYCSFASEREKVKSGSKIRLSNSPAGSTLNAMLSKNPLPPPTLQIELSADRNYSRLPTMTSIEPYITIASGISAPKIITLVASNGRRYKQLVKGGADDLRQDAIMEQVFAQVSELLKENSATRQRNLGIRTYKVLPLSSTAGIIEFVSNTIPLHEFLMPAHERFYPKDLKSQQCRSEIQSVQTQKLDVRVKKYLAVTDKFHPVLRYFYLERFPDPDEWFAKRLAYTRSTAAISMLGYVLGLGDRHGHNILLDEKSGEVVHIDLGVAFEMGRVLPVPELVPFRLTRDIVDGMGISKTEGVYRRCCEFTLEALRKEGDTIMTILDVLRYDPLYTWSISPVRLAKLQDAQSAAPISTASSTTTIYGKAKGEINEPSEADRALTVVRKKLSKTLSVTATVNDLINQATDERNLAVLFAGWAAYA